MNAFFYTLGCKLNQMESEALAYEFQRHGIKIVQAEESADIIILNTCTVTARSEQKARRVLRHLLGACARALPVITGCYAQVEYAYLAQTLAGGEKAVVIPQERKDLLLGLPRFLKDHPEFRGGCRAEKYRIVQDYLQECPGTGHDVFAFHAGKYAFHSRAFLKIQDGCDHFCAFCRVPLARGRSVSLDPVIIGKRVEELAASGFREIVLTGVDISAYRHTGHDLAALLGLLTDGTQNVRFRLSSLEPESIDERLARALSHGAVCPHFHLPLQSGSDRVLAAMKRRSTSAVLRRAAAMLKEIQPGAFLAADVIVGFPGESDEDFQLTRNLLKELKLHKLHVFPFSSRPGTPAALMQPQTPPLKIRERALDLLELSDRLLDDFLRSRQGREAEVILEKKCSDTVWRGSTAQSFKCEITGMPPDQAKAGALVKARITDRGKGMTCMAEFIDFDRRIPLFFKSRHV